LGCVENEGIAGIHFVMAGKLTSEHLLSKNSNPITSRQKLIDSSVKVYIFA